MNRAIKFKDFVTAIGPCGKDLLSALRTLRASAGERLNDGWTVLANGTAFCKLRGSGREAAGWRPQLALAGNTNPRRQKLRPNGQTQNQT